MNTRDGGDGMHRSCSPEPFLQEPSSNPANLEGVWTGQTSRHRGLWVRNSKAWCPWSGGGVVGSLAQVGHLHEQTEQINRRWPVALILAAPTSALPHARLPRDVAQRGGRVQWAGLGGQPAVGLESRHVSTTCCVSTLGGAWEEGAWGTGSNWGGDGP